MQRSLDQQRRAAHQRRQGQRAGQPLPQRIQVPEEEPEREEEIKDESIVVSRRVLESRLIDLCKGIFECTARNVSKACDAVSYSALTLIASVIRDIPTSVPDLISNGLIPAIVECYNTRIPMEENYLRDLLRGINAIVLHHDGCKLVSDSKVVYPILQSLLKEEYAVALGSAHFEAYEESARQLLSLYSQAEPLRTVIVRGVQNFFLGMYKKSEVLIQKLGDALQVELKTGSAAEKDHILEKCSQYAQALRGILYFTVALIQNEESTDHKKLLASLNADCELVRSALQLLSCMSILGVYVKNVRKTITHFTLIFRRYVNDVFNNKENTEVIMKIVGDRINYISGRLGPIDKTAHLGDFVNGKRSLALDKDDPATPFPLKDQITIFLATIESTCEIIKIFGVSYTEHEELLRQLNETNKLLIRETIRICKEEIGESAIKLGGGTEEENKKSKEERGYYSIPLNTEYRVQLDQAYQQIRKCFILIMKSAIAKRRYEAENDNKFLKVLQSIGRITSQNVADAATHLEKFMEPPAKIDQLAYLLYDIMVIEDVKLTLLNESSLSQLTQDFIKSGGLDHLFDLYQLAVKETIQGKKESKLHSEVFEGLSPILSLVMSIFERFLDPTNIKRQMQLTKHNFSEQGFKSPEDYMASLVIYLWERLLFKTDYEEYASCVKFLSECNKKAFELFLAIIKRNSDRKTISSMLTFEPRSRRDALAFRYMPFLGRMEGMRDLGQLRRAGEGLPPLAGAPDPSLNEPGSEQPATAPARPPINIRKIEAKDFVKELEKFFSYIIGSFYEALYSVTSYKCKKLLFNLVENQENATLYKTENLFVQLLNELQTIIFSLEFTFEATLIPLEDGASYPDFADIPLTPTLREKIEKTKSSDYTEEHIMATTKISMLIDLIVTFVKQSKKSDLMGILCKNRLSRVFVAALGVIGAKDRIWHNKELLPKILVILSMIYKEVFAHSQQHELEEKLQHMDEERKVEENIPPVEEIKKLMQTLGTIIEIEEDLEKSGTLPKDQVIITNEVFTLTLLVIHSLTKSFELASEIQASDIIPKLLAMKTKAPQRDKIPAKLFVNAVFNLFESPEVLEEYMKRIVTATLFARAEAKSDILNKKTKVNIEEMQKKTEVSLDDFVENMQFLSVRNPRIFAKACRSVTELHKLISKGKESFKYLIALTKEAISKVIHDRKHRVPEIPLNSPQMHIPGKGVLKSSSKDNPEARKLIEYKSLLQNGIKDGSGLLSRANMAIVQQLLERLIDIHFTLTGENKQPTTETPELVITENVLLETIGELVRIYPEIVAHLLTFKSVAHPKITGTTLVSFLVRSLFPSRYLNYSKGEPTVTDNDKWRNHTLKFTKNLIYEAKSLLSSRHRVLLSEMRRRIVLELLTVLSNQSSEKKQQDLSQKSLALLYSSLSIFEGLFCNLENTITFPIQNVFRIIRLSLSAPGLSLVKLCMDILKSLNLNSSQAELLTAKLVKILERLTRFNTQKVKDKDQKEDTNVLMLSEESDSMQNLHINPVVREIAEREQELESGEEEEEDIYSEAYVESPEAGGEEYSGESVNEEMEEGGFDVSEGNYDESEGEEEAEEGERSVPMEIPEEEMEVPEAEEDVELSESEEEEMPGEEQEDMGLEGEEEEISDEEAERNELDMEESSLMNEVGNIPAEEWAAIEDEESEESNTIRILPPERTGILRQLNGEPYTGRDVIRAHRPGGLHAAHVGIDAPPRHHRVSRTTHLADVYERIPDDALNSQIMPYIRPETMGEDEGHDGTTHRIYLHMQLMRSNEMPVIISRSEEERRRVPVQGQLYGEGKHKDTVVDLIKKQFINGGLPVIEVTKEETKEEEMKEIKVVSEGEEKPEQPPEKKEPEAPKSEEVKKEEKVEASPSQPQMTPEVLAQRRAELAAIVPGVQVEDSLLTQIDFDFLRALPESMRLQAVEPFIARPRHIFPRDLLPESLLASLGSEADILSMLPPGLGGRRRREQEEEEEEKRESKESLEDYLIKANEGNIKEREIIENVAEVIKDFDDKGLETILRLLYLNVATKIPINALIGNVCYAKSLTGKTLDALLFILVHYPTYESKMRGAPKVTGTVSRITLSDTTFPPLCLYNGMELAHLTYYILPLRVFALLSHLLRIPYVIRYLLPRDLSKPVHLSSLASIRKLRKQIVPKAKDKPVQTPLSEILSLIENHTFRTSVVHLETFIQFIIDLFKHYDESSKKSEKSEASSTPPLIDSTTVRQICKLFFLDAQTDKACNKLVDLLTKLSFAERNAKVIIEETGNTIEAICETLLKEWKVEVQEIEDHKVPKTTPEHGEEEISSEFKLVRLITLLKGLYKGHTKKEDENDVRPFKFTFEEEDSIGEFSPMSKKLSMVEPEEGNKLSIEIRKQVMQLYERPLLADTFDSLTDLMACITRSGGQLGATVKNQLLFKLVPAIEALIIAYNHMFNDPFKSREFMKQIREAKVKKGYVFSSKMAFALYKFLKDNHKTVNNLIRQLEIQSFLSLIKPFIARFPYFLDFDNKRTYFRNELRKMHKHNTLKLNVSRANVFVDSYSQLASKSPEETMGRLRVTFRGEAAVDAGGVTREWYTILSRAMFNPDICLFKRSAHGNTYQPDPKSGIETNHINYFHFIGRIIGKALLDGMYLDCFFTRAFYKIIVGQTLNIHDLEDSDMELYKGLEWLRDNDATVLDSTFSYTLDYFGEIQVRELIENGKNIPVTNENKHDFIVRMCKAKLYEEIKPQMEALLKGLYEIIPRKLISIFDAKEIELLISGLPDIDIFDLKRNTEYNGYTETSEVIKWLWEILESYSSRERAEFLQFVTGTSKVPLDGFKNLPGAFGIQKFQIHKVHGGAERLPAAHTCFNQLDLPEYPSKEILQERLMKAIKEGAEFMGLLQGEELIVLLSWNY
eukprot:TRINITY_DN474_c0_g1_i1.p1 TRINITY_DN474_c0_g1~~TRINITY_DN474_c0_g1_i1.p1  ORF type:complete len:2898 (-),score=379.62 TRINITY_DN474_c0_g1_i1:5788-14481(-)